MRRVLVFATSVALLLTPAATPDNGRTTGTTGASGGREARGLSSTVSAASSLTDAFGEIGAAFEAAEPGHHRDVQLRALGRPRGPDQRGRAGRRVRLREPDLDGRRSGTTGPA